jgi:hypothetical protein
MKTFNSGIEFNGLPMHLDVSFAFKQEDQETIFWKDDEEDWGYVDWHLKLKSFIEFNGTVWVTKSIPKMWHKRLLPLLRKKFPKNKIVIPEGDSVYQFC